MSVQATIPVVLPGSVGPATTLPLASTNSTFKIESVPFPGLPVVVIVRDNAEMLIISPFPVKVNAPKY